MTIANQVPVIDTDAHVTEPMDLWTSRLPRKWQDLGPRVVHDDATGGLRWILNGEWLTPIGSYSMAGWKEPFPSYPPTWAEIDPACYDGSARLARMDEYGIQAQVIFPNIIGFDTEVFLRLDEDVRLACVQAYNDFLVDFASPAPERFILATMLPFWDVDASVAEMVRCRDRGHRAVLWAANYDRIGYPYMTDPHWDPIYEVAQDLELSMNLHIGFSNRNADDRRASEWRLANYTPMRHVRQSSMMFQSNVIAMIDLVLSDVLERYPTLNWVSVESGFGFVPFILESMDWQWMNNGGPKDYPGRMLPSEYFLRQVYATFWFEEKTLPLLEVCPDNVMFETDFPHPTSLTPGPGSWSEAPDVVIAKHLARLPEHIVRKVLFENAARVYHIA